MPGISLEECKLTDTKQNQRDCKSCKRSTLHVATIQKQDLGCGFVLGNLILCVFTLGLWIPIFILILGMGIFGNSLAPLVAQYHCQVCGVKNGRSILSIAKPIVVSVGLLLFLSALKSLIGDGGTTSTRTKRQRTASNTATKSDGVTPHSHDQPIVSVDPEVSSISDDQKTSEESRPNNQPPRVSKTDAKAERILNERHAAYLVALKQWQDSKQERDDKIYDRRGQLTLLITKLKSDVPAPPVFEPRKWSSGDKKFTTTATLVYADFKTAKLKKPNGKTITVPKDKLDKASRLLINKAAPKFARHKSSLAKRTAKLAALEEELLTVGDLYPPPSAPEKDQIIAELRIAEQKKQEQADAAAAAAAKRIANAKREKAANEYDQNGLVMLRNTVSGTASDFGGEITGIVVNRRSRKLSYAQITFNLYDSSGAQVGSALANINGLEPGGRWRFQASCFGVDFNEYKVSELTGF